MQTVTQINILSVQEQATIYIDGPDHDSIQARDADITECLENQGYSCLRFSYRNQTDWPNLCRAHSYLFGEGRS
ncbi:DUF559 domain-containing protein [Anaerolineales bacterium HSG24]|nr:DUF559 domain-containing protein [Anaerolineales bacterium HSG24]